MDTVATYRNEQGVGDAIASAAPPREQLFITTKLQLDRLDLYLIIGPVRNGATSSIPRGPSRVAPAFQYSSLGSHGSQQLFILHVRNRMQDACIELSDWLAALDFFGPIGVCKGCLA